MAVPLLPSLPWLARLAISIPPYGGYRERGHRHATDFAFREAMDSRLGVIKIWLDQGIQACEAGGADRHVASLRRVLEHANRVGQEFKRPWHALDTLARAGTLSDEQAARLHAVDHRILERMSELVEWLDRSRATSSHDRLAHVESGLLAVDGLLDERSGLMRELASRQAPGTG